VTQLAEDRSLLNSQLASLSRGLREKEQELPILQREHRTLKHQHTLLQAKVRLHHVSHLCVGALASVYMAHGQHGTLRFLRFLYQGFRGKRGLFSLKIEESYHLLPLNPRYVIK